MENAEFVALSHADALAEYDRLIQLGETEEADRLRAAWWDTNKTSIVMPADGSSPVGDGILTQRSVGPDNSTMRTFGTVLTVLGVGALIFTSASDTPQPLISLLSSWVLGAGISLWIMGAIEQRLIEIRKAVEKTARAD
jgi:hypothetical protein